MEGSKIEGDMKLIAVRLRELGVDGSKVEGVRRLWQ